MIIYHIASMWSDNIKIFSKQKIFIFDPFTFIFDIITIKRTFGFYWFVIVFINFAKIFFNLFYFWSRKIFLDFYIIKTTYKLLYFWFRKPMHWKYWFQFPWWWWWWWWWWQFQNKKRRGNGLATVRFKSTGF